MGQVAKKSALRTRVRPRPLRARQPAPSPAKEGVTGQAVRHSKNGGALRPEQILAMQQIAGNRAVSQMLAQRAAAPPLASLVQRADPPSGDRPSDLGPGEDAEKGKVAIPTAIGYIGMNPGAAKEARALKRVSKDKVLISLDDPKAHKKMNTDEGLGVYIYKDLGIDPTVNMPKFIAAFLFLKSVDFWGREQVGHMMKWFSDAEAGKYKLERLVMSGHSDGVDIWGESEDEKDEPGSLMLHRDLAKLAAIYPKAAAQVQDIMFSACWSVMAIKKMVEIFPNLQTVWGYIGFSPNIEQGSAKHIKKWEMTTRGERTPHKRDRKGKASIWTRDEGYIAGSPADYDLKELKAEYDGMVPRAGEMYNGETDLDGDFLRDVYFQLQLISIHPDTDPATVKKARVMLEKTLRLRYWSKITGEFWKTHNETIKKAHTGFPVKKPSYFSLSRPALKKHMDAIEEELAKKDHPDAREYLENLLRPGLWELDPNLIPDTWI